MDRWLIEVLGERMDLEELPRYFPDGDVYAIEENGKFYLLGSALESLADAEAIRAEAAT